MHSNNDCVQLIVRFKRKNFTVNSTLQNRTFRFRKPCNNLNSYSFIYGLN
ncbi:hypothetical protein PGB90_008599 [Kerria lacca]